MISFTNCRDLGPLVILLIGGFLLSIRLIGFIVLGRSIKALRRNQYRENTVVGFFN